MPGIPGAGERAVQSRERASEGASANRLAPSVWLEIKPFAVGHRAHVARLPVLGVARIYVADGYGNQVWVVDPATDTLTTTITLTENFASTHMIATDRHGFA
jgi:YVTN family beta-propeller protein